MADVEEVITLCTKRGLASWQSCLISNSQLLSSQSDMFSSVVTADVKKNKGDLYFALTGDFSCIMTPVLPPPPKWIVCKWLMSNLEQLHGNALSKECDILETNNSGDFSSVVDVSIMDSCLKRKEELRANSKKNVCSLFCMRNVKKKVCFMLLCIIK